MIKMHIDNKKGPIIYNIFPKLIGQIENWMPHIERAKKMGFDWIYVNPFHITGRSGSIYAIKDHFSFNALFFPIQNNQSPKKLLKSFIKKTREKGLRIMADLVINHTSTQSHLLREHPDWYKRDERGRIINPGAMHKGKMVYWRDLAEIDNAGSTDRDALWKYWRSVTKYYLDLGFRGFRCDAAYQVPADLWHFLIQYIKSIDPQVRFFAETLGCSVEQTLEVANAGFDYIYNSFKWWNMKDAWFLDQLRQTQPVVPSVSFPESHDTKRLAEELKDDIAAIKRKYLISALITKGVMITIGFEFGFHKRLNVKNTAPENWEEKHFDLSEFIKKVNKLKASYQIFNEETPIVMLPFRNSDIKLILKTSASNQECLIIINQRRSSQRRVNLDLAEVFDNGNPDGSPLNIEDISIEDRISKLPPVLDIKFKPDQVKVLLQRC